jgi:hypothetical protein
MFELGDAVLVVRERCPVFGLVQPLQRRPEFCDSTLLNAVLPLAVLHPVIGLL